MSMPSTSLPLSWLLSKFIGCGWRDREAGSLGREKDLHFQLASDTWLWAHDSAMERIDHFTLPSTRF